MTWILEINTKWYQVRVVIHNVHYLEACDLCCWLTQTWPILFWILELNTKWYQVRVAIHNGTLVCGYWLVLLIHPCNHDQLCDLDYSRGKHQVVSSQGGNTQWYTILMLVTCVVDSHTQSWTTYIVIWIVEIKTEELYRVRMAIQICTLFSNRYAEFYDNCGYYFRHTYSPSWHDQLSSSTRCVLSEMVQSFLS